MRISKDAQAVIIRRTKSNPLFLLLKRFDKDKQKDHYRLVKGGVKNNESTAEAAERETFEEVGIKKVTNLGVIGKYEYTVGDIKHEVEVYLLDVLNEKLSLDSAEEGGFIIKDAVWLTKEDAIAKLNFTDEKKMVKKASSKIISF